MKRIFTESELVKLINHFINETKSNLNEAKKTTKTQKERIELIGNMIIKYMEMKGLTNIPNYRFLFSLPKTGNEEFDKTFGKFKAKLQYNLYEGDFENFVVPYILNKHKDFTYVPAGFEKLVDDDIKVGSLGEVIVYNTFKMNGEKLIVQPVEFRFTYEFEGKTRLKKPDFYWEKRQEIIEVSGLDDVTYGTNYTKKLMAAAQEMKRQGKKYVILDYYKFRNRPDLFYKFVCEYYNFPYDPANFEVVSSFMGKNKEQIEKELEQLALNTNKSSGERDRQAKYLKYLGWKSFSQYQQETGIGLIRSDKDYRKKVQKAWCLSSGSNIATEKKFKELFPEISISKGTIEEIKKYYPEEFDKNKVDEICSIYKLENED